MGYNQYTLLLIEILTRISNRMAYFSDFIIIILFSGLFIHSIHQTITFQLYYQYLVDQHIIEPLPLPIMNDHEYHYIGHNQYGHNIPIHSSLMTHNPNALNTMIISGIQSRYNSDTLNHDIINNDYVDSGNADTNYDSNGNNDEELSPSRVVNHRLRSPFLVQPALQGQNMQHWYDLYNAENDNQQDTNDNENGNDNVEISNGEQEEEQYDEQDDEQEEEQYVEQGYGQYDEEYDEEYDGQDYEQDYEEYEEQNDEEYDEQNDGKIKFVL